MESDSAPKKRQRLSSTSSQATANIPVVECVRQFALPQTFPSMKPSKDSNGVNGTVKPSAGSGKLQKLKLKSPDGRELGEFDVQILPKDTPATNKNGKKISFSLETPLITTSSLIDTTANRDSSNTLVATATTPINTNQSSLLKVPPGSTYKSLNKNPYSAIKYLVPPSMKNVNVKMTESSVPSGLMIPLGSNIVTNPIYLDNNQVLSSADNDDDNDSVVVETGNGWKVLQKKQPNALTSMRNVQTNGVNAGRNIIINSKNGQKQTLLRKGMSLLNTGQNSPLRNIKDSNRIQVNGKVNGHLMRIAGNKRTFDHGYTIATGIKEPKLINYIDNNSNGIIEIDDSNLDNNTVYVVQNEDDLLDQVEKELDNQSTRQSYTLTNSQGRVNLIRRGSNKNSNNNNSSSNKYDGNVSPTRSSRSSYLREDLTDDEIASKLSVVGEALSTVSDHDLRERALKALAECGIGVERFVPKKPPLNYMSVKESQTQTNVFGLLDENNFISVTGDTDGITRLQEIERQIIVDDTKINEKPSVDIVKFKQDLDKVLDSDWVNKTNMEQVKELLKVNPLVEKAYRLLEREINSCKKYDDDGLLIIHKAVLKNNERALKRHIMVLRASKATVDFPTKDGQTSLELAIQHSASPEIVNLLLKNGANPVSPENAHDSALTIASRTTSEFLPKLVKYLLPNNPAINNVDSEGFTALHHCSRNGDLKGVKSLLSINVDVNARDCKSGRTALFHAFENNYLPICKELLDAGAKPIIPNYSGHTVLTIFDEEKHFMLKDYFAKIPK
ncbi:uncharacterized protein LOC130663526 [Microplitis mediator]|uniref:uncharacterized protein LOC130663526 n=1 Tax=Microplitis mediator TaxID=375433 RepID=UPI00255481DE|nr:uncharacterized protein LOC130663526 [Microplitis mediator]